MIYLFISSSQHLLSLDMLASVFGTRGPKMNGMCRPLRNLQSTGGGEEGAHLNSDSTMHSETWLVMKIWNRLAEK